MVATIVLTELCSMPIFSFGKHRPVFALGGDNLEGSDENLDNNHLMQMAGRLAHQLRGYASANNIPVECRKIKMSRQPPFGEQIILTLREKVIRPLPIFAQSIHATG